VDVVAISKRLGHSNPNITPRISVRLFRQKDDRAARVINDALVSLGGSK